jgi:dolichol-phosphate mannosyltransferase
MTSLSTIPQPILSVLVPVHNEEACLGALYRRLSDVLAPITPHYEILFVDDGSTDGSLAILRALAEEDPHVGFYSFTRNFGHEAALTCGLHEVRGKAVVLIDADLQDPPELIPQMFELWKKGFQIICAQRRRRAGESALTKWTSFLFYRLLKKLTTADIPIDTGDFRLMDASVVEAFRNMKEKNRFVRGMLSWTGYRQITVPYDRDARAGGDTKYNLIKRVRLAFDAVCSLSMTPLRIVTGIGLFTTLCSFLAGCAILIHKLFFGLNIPGYALLGIGLFFISGVQLLFLGVIGEYIGRIFIEVQERPLFVLRDSHPTPVRTSVHPVRSLHYDQHAI